MEASAIEKSPDETQQGNTISGLVIRLSFAILLALVGSSSPVAAHELSGTRFDAPIPLSFLYLGAGLTVALTAVWLARGEDVPTDRPGRPALTLSEGRSRLLRTGASLSFLLFFTGVIIVGLTGPQVRAENAATLFTWAIWLKGLGLVAAVVGSPWRVLSPWRTIYQLLSTLEGEPIALLGRYPSWLGEWPALVGYLLWLGIIENLTTIPRSPRATVALLAGYAVVMLLGGLAFGEDWFERADALSVLYRLFGRVAPVRVERSPNGYRVTLRPPWRGCLEPVNSRASVGFVVATVYTVSFDGFTATAAFQGLFFDAKAVLGTGSATSLLLYAGGFGLFVLVFAVIASAAEALGLATTAAADGVNRSAASPLQSLAPSVLPIAVAYEVAHNYAFVLTNIGPLIAAVLAGVVGNPPAPNLLAWLPLPVFWATQIVLVVGGHVVAVVAAHRVTRSWFSLRTAATRAHLPITGLMVAYTVLSLWIISQPIVQ